MPRPAGPAHRMRPSRIAAFAFAALALASPAGAAAATFPATGTPLSDPYALAVDPTVAVDGVGDAVAGWLAGATVSGSSNTQASGRAVNEALVQVSVRSVAGTFGPPQTLSTAGREAGQPQVAIDPRGDAVVAWTEYLGSGGQILRAASRPSGGTFGTPETLSDPTHVALSPEVGVAADGSAVVAWSDGSGTLLAATRTGLAPFGAPITLSVGSSAASGPTVSVAAGGATAVGWSTAASEVWLAQATSPSALTAGTAKRVSDAGELAVQPLVAAAPSGTVTVGYEQRHPGSGMFDYTFDVRARTVSAAGVASPSQTLSPATKPIAFALAGDPSGRVTTAIEYQAGANATLDVRTAEPGAAFGPAQTLDATSALAGPSVAAGTDGSALVAWHTSTAQGVPVVAAIRPAGAAAFGAPQTLDAAAAYGQPATAMATADIASVVWPSRVAGSKSQIFSASTGAGVLPAGTGPPPVGGSTTPPPVVVNPVLTIGKVTLTAPKPKKGKKAPKHGPKYVSVSVTTTAHVAGEVMITKSAKGVVKGTSCVAPPKKKAKGKKPKSCTRVIAVGKPVTAAIDPGKPTVFTFTRTTPVGRYTLSAYGTGTGNVSAKPVSTTFTVK